MRYCVVIEILLQFFVSHFDMSLQMSRRKPSALLKLILKLKMEINP
jgi:hypothetical protein